MAKIVQDAYIFDKFLLLDSRDRAYSTVGGVTLVDPINNFQFYLPVDANQTSFLAIYSCNFENHINNINQYNNMIKVSVLTSSVTRTIPVGNYTTAALIAAINTALTAESIILTQSALTGLISITSAPGADVTWESANAGSDPYILPSMLGYTVYPIKTIGGIAKVAVQKPSIYYTRFVDIQSKVLTKYQASDVSTSQKTSNNILRLFINSPDDVINFENRLLNKYVFEKTSNIGIIDIELVDEWGQPLLLLGDFTINVMLFKQTTMHHIFNF